MADLVPEKSVGTKGVEVHIPAHAHQLWPGEVVEREIILKNLADFDDIGLSRGFSGCANLDTGVSWSDSCGA